MFKVYLNRQLLLGFLTALAIISLMALYSFTNTRKLISSSEWIADTNDVLYHSQKLLFVAANLEVGQRGFVITGNEDFLNPYQKSFDDITNYLDTLRKITARNPNHRKRTGELGDAIEDLKQFASHSVSLRRESFEAAVDWNATMEGKKCMDRIRRLVADIEHEEKQLRYHRTALNEEQIREFNYSYIGLLLVTALVLVGLFYTMNSALGLRIQTEQSLVAASSEIEDLYDNAPCGYHSLNNEGVFIAINKTLLTWLGFEHKSEVIGKVKFEDVIASKDAVIFRENYAAFKKRGTVSDIEFDFKRKDGSEFPVILNSIAVIDHNGNFVKSRSTTFDNTVHKKFELEVMEVNKELEAFTYSVSHDLRAPLRSIDGYSRILHEDYQDKLDAEGQRLIHVIINNAKRMGKLIDDLLDFSRLGRKDLQCSFVDMDALVKATASELIAQEPNRKITVQVVDLQTCYADVDMIRQVWINLISNAVKYTGKTAEAIITISSRETGAEIEYRIEDNGVGFEMQYVGKLFGVFQRLHRIQDFTGTGVGLAIVKRIVSRHNGRVWAEGKVNEGATFYFTIPKS